MSCYPIVVKNITTILKKKEEHFETNDFDEKIKAHLRALEELDTNLNAPIDIDNKDDTDTKVNNNDKHNTATIMIKVNKPDNTGELPVRIFQNDFIGKIITSLEKKYGKKVKLTLDGNNISSDTCIKDLELEDGDILDAFYF